MTHTKDKSFPRPRCERCEKMYFDDQQPRVNITLPPDPLAEAIRNLSSPEELEDFLHNYLHDTYIGAQIAPVTVSAMGIRANTIVRMYADLHPEYEAPKLGVTLDDFGHVYVCKAQEKKMNRPRRPWGVPAKNWEHSNNLFSTWLREREGIVVYENQDMWSSQMGFKSFIPALFYAEGFEALQPAPARLGNVPSNFQERVDHIKLEDFGGDVELAIRTCFFKEEAEAEE